MPEVCARCDERLPQSGDKIPREGWRNVLRLETITTTVRQRLRVRIWRFHGLTPRAMDQVTASDAVIDVCSDCAAGLWLWAQGDDAGAAKRANEPTPPPYRPAPAVDRARTTGGEGGL